MSQPPHPAPSLEAVQALCSRFRDARHDLNNVFAVLLALAELGQRNPANHERLGKAVLERCPKVLQDLQAFQDELFGLLETLQAAAKDSPR
jgi:hypothetical protein